MRTLLLLTVLISNFAHAEEMSCKDYGTLKDPYMQRAIGPKGPFDRNEEIMFAEQRLKDAIRCKHKSDADIQRNMLRIFREEAAKEAGANAPAAPVADTRSEESLNATSDIQSALLGTPAKRIQVTCLYGVKKPIQSFQLEGIEDTAGLVVASGYFEDVAIELKFSNRDLSLGRALKTTIGNASFDKFLKPGHGPIEYKSGLLSKAMGVDGKYKVQCFPEQQRYILPQAGAEPVAASDSAQ
jgi:hypothetical protein